MARKKMTVAETEAYLTRVKSKLDAVSTAARGLDDALEKADVDQHTRRAIGRMIGVCMLMREYQTLNSLRLGEGNKVVDVALKQVTF